MRISLFSYQIRLEERLQPKLAVSTLRVISRHLEREIVIARRAELIQSRFFDGSKSHPPFAFQPRKKSITASDRPKDLRFLGMNQDERAIPVNQAILFR